MIHLSLRESLYLRKVYSFQAKKLNMRQRNFNMILMGLTQCYLPSMIIRNDRNYQITS